MKPRLPNFRTLRHRCPCCDHRLCYIVEDGTTVVWCGYFKCRSYKANDGIKGNQGESKDQLAKMLIEELQGNPDWPVETTISDIIK